MMWWIKKKTKTKKPNHNSKKSLLSLSST